MAVAQLSNLQDVTVLVDREDWGYRQKGRVCANDNGSMYDSEKYVRENGYGEEKREHLANVTCYLCQHYYYPDHQN